MAGNVTAWRAITIITCVAVVIVLLLGTGTFITSIITVEEVKREGHGIKSMGKMAGGQAELLEEQLSSLQKSANVQAQQNTALLNKLDQLQQPGIVVDIEGRWDPIPIDYSNVPAAGNANATVQGPPRKLDVADDPNASWPLNIGSSGVTNCLAISSVNASRYFVAWVGPSKETNHPALFGQFHSKH